MEFAFCTTSDRRVLALVEQGGSCNLDKLFGIAVFLTAAIQSPVAHAAPSYSELKVSGFAASRLIQRPSGAWGWYLTKDNLKYYCRQSVGLMRKGNRIGNFVQGGQFVSTTISEFRRGTGGQDPMRYPTFEEATSSHPPAFVVGKCERIRTQ